METLSENRTEEMYQHDFLRDGVYVFKKIFDEAALQILKNEIDQIRETVMAKIANVERPLSGYSDIAEREPGRLDYRCGFTGKVFDEIAKPVMRIINKLSPRIDFRHYWGAIPSLPGSGPTPMHRDVYPILNTSEGVNIDIPDLSLPPYYFTVLIPLMDITLENGPTQFIKGSNHIPIVDDSKAEIYMPLLAPGDIVIFDGRTLHRGSANNSKEERMVAYITFVANWYHDQTFEINNYLFPELA